MKGYTNEEKEEKNKKRIFFYIAIIIIIILSLITSCSCTSGLFGKIGGFFSGEGNHEIDDNTDDSETIKNKYLKFDQDELEISLSDTKAKLTFSYEYIIPRDFTCITSDASIATCYVENDYVVINPKKEGTVTVTLSAKANDKIYEATATVHISASKRYIELSSTEGVIDLRNGKIKNISYTLVGLSGIITITSSDSNIATATVKDNIITITAKKTGNVLFTFSLEQNGTVYEAFYNLTVVNGTTGGKPIKPIVPENPNPNEPDNPIINKSSDSSLKLLSPSKGSLDFNPNKHTYSMTVGFFTGKISFDALPNHEKATMSYIYNGTKVDSLDKLKLNVGENTVMIVVTAEDGSTSTYEVVIRREEFITKNYLKELSPSVGTLEPAFDKSHTHYDMTVEYEVDKISFNAVPKNKKAHVYYTFRNESVGSLQDLKLEVGLNVVTVTVVSPDGKSSRTYEVFITRKGKTTELDRDNTLKELIVAGSELNFNPNEENYQVMVPATTNNVSITATPNSSKANIVSVTLNGVETDINNLGPLKEGSNLVTIVVEAESGEKKTYTVTIIKTAKDGSNLLTNIETNKGTLLPEFKENKGNYTIYLEQEKDITLTVTKHHQDAELTYYLNGKKLDTKENKVTYPLIEGKNTIEIYVTNPNGSVNVYTVDVINKVPEKDKNCLLQSIVTTPATKFTFDPKSDEPIYIGVKSDVDKITIDAKAESDKAKVEYIIPGQDPKTDLNDLPLQLGDNKVIIRVTAEDEKYVKEYTVIINKSNAKLSSLKDSEGKLDQIFDPDQTAYKVELESSVDKISLYPNLNPYENSEMHFTIDGQEVTDLNNIELQYGQTKIVHILVKSKSTGEERTYVVELKRKDLSANNNLSNIEIIRPTDVSLTEKFTPEKTDYHINVKYEDKEITLKATKEDDKSNIRVEYEYNGVKYESLDQLPLGEKDNVVKIIVTAENGDEKVYTVTIQRPERTIQFGSTLYEIYLERIQALDFTLLEIVDGVSNDITFVEPSKYDVKKDIKVTFGDNYVGSYEIVNGFLTLKPNGSMNGQETTVTLVYDGVHVATTTVKFLMDDYTITSPRLDYDMTLSNAIDSKNERTILLNTNIFKDKVEVKKEGKNLILCSPSATDCNVFVKVELMTNSEAIKSIDYNETEVGPNSLPIVFTAKDVGVVDIKVSIGILGHVLEDKTLNLTLTISKKYVVTLDANGGIFNPLNNKYEFLLSKDEELDLSLYNIPYKVVETNPCLVYEFLGYSKDPTALVPDSLLEVQKQTDPVTGEVEKKVNYIVNNLDNDLTLYAIYDKIDTEPKEPEEKELWLTDIDLFHNEEYFSKYNEDKVIYPGASGAYKEVLKNESDNTIKITKLYLKEDTICIPQYNGCLNMGYVVRYYRTGIDSFSYYYLGAADKYAILNKEAAAINNTLSYRDMLANKTRLEIDIPNDKPIELAPGEEIEFIISWQWPFEIGEDALDTAIGNQAAASKDQQTINDKYKLYFGIKYEIDEPTCN